MCYGWYEEVLLQERIRRATHKADELKQPTESRPPAQEREKAPKPERQTETQPDAVPA